MVDEYKLYFGDSIKITDNIYIHQPIMDDIKETGEKDYLKFIYNFTATHMDDSVIVFLSNLGLDFTQITDWDLFLSLCNSFDSKASSLLFGDLDFSTFRAANDENGNVFIHNKDGVIITEPIYKLIVDCVRKINNIPIPKFNKILDNDKQKRMAINHAKIKIENSKRKELCKPSGSFFLPIMSNLSLHYSFEELRKTNIFRFWYNAKRLRACKDTDHLYYGLYSGSIDIEKNPSLKKQLDYMRALD